MKSRKIAIILLITMMAWIVPMPSVFAVENNIYEEQAEAVDNNAETPEEPEPEEATVGESSAETAGNQVVVLYEDGELPQDASESEMEEIQEEILGDAVDGDISIEETIVVEADDEEAEDMVVGVISSEEYDTEDLAEIIQESESVKYAEPNYVYKISSVPGWNDTYINDSWQLGDRGVSADKAPAPKSGGKPIVVAVMDTGVDYAHPDLASRMWTAPSGFKLKGKYGVDFADGDTDPMDENGHGTHCAGIIAAAANNSTGVAGVAGTNANVKIMAVKVFDESGGGTLDSIVRGYRYLIRAVKAGVNIKAVNCSFGAEVTSEIFDEVIEQAGQNGILTVAAAGNASTNNDTANMSPANSKSDYVVVVAATDENGDLASFSNYGKTTVDIGAPGTNILSTVSSGNYAPYLYDSAKLKQTTQFYGEFGGAELITGSDGSQSVIPKLGTDYNGSAVSGVGEFGASRMYSVLSGGSSGKASLEFVSGDSGESFNIGNNTCSLRWKISGGQPGDQYILYFPYEKRKGTPWINAVYKTHSEISALEFPGVLSVGDVRIDDIDPDGTVSWSVPGTEDQETLQNVGKEMNSIWSASGKDGVVYDRVDVKDLEYGRYGLGFVYQANSREDVYIDISSLAVAKADADPDDFGKYDVYSGTSEATPMVTGAAAIAAAANPDMTAEDIKATILGTTRANASVADKCSTGGVLDFNDYSAETNASKPAISSVTADFANKKVTIKGKGFGTKATLKITAVRNATKQTVAIKSSDISVPNSKTIVISNAGYGGYRLIGSDIKFTISNGSKTGEGSAYIVKGLQPYNEEFMTKYEGGEEFMLLDETTEVPATDLDSEGLEEPALMPKNLSYVNGADDLYKYNPGGDIYYLDYADDNKVPSATLRGDLLSTVLSSYAAKKAEKSDQWIIDKEGGVELLNYSLAANPAYMGDVIYELVRVDMVDRVAYLLMGLSLNNPDDKWEVYYDSLIGKGSKPNSLDWSTIEDCRMVGYNGRLYILGGNSSEEFDAEKEEYSTAINKGVFSCAPNVNGTKWVKSGELPAERTKGRAIVQGGKLYYFFTNDAEGNLDYSIYAFNGKKWSKAGTLPKSLFADVKDPVLTWIGEVLMITMDLSDTILCATGIDSKGIVFAGKSFDGSGDTFRFNTSTGKIQPLKYSLWETISDRPVDGATRGKKLYVEYAKDATEEAEVKSIPISSGYVKLDRVISGEGKGRVYGGGTYAKGEKAKIRIVPGKGSYIYSVKVDGSSPKLDKTYGKATKVSKKTKSTTFNAKKDGTLEVYFGKISTKIKVPKKTLKRRVGKRTLPITTDGTISTVRFKSGNRKYARVNKDGTVTFKKAGVGKTVTLTAISTENPKIKAKIKVKIISREWKKFVWGKKKVRARTKVFIDRPLAKSKTPKSFKVRNVGNEMVRLTWKKSKNVSGYIVFRRTGNKGRYVQVARLSADKSKFTDDEVRTGRTYKYIVVSYKKVKGSKSIRISPRTKMKKVRV